MQADLGLAASGAYFPGKGIELHLRTDATDAEREMAVLHERAHLALSLTSEYGALLRAFGTAPSYLIRGGVLEGLVSACRTTHEVYATALGVWLTGGGSAILSRYPGYGGYLEIARTLTHALPDASTAAYAALSAACTAAMRPSIGEWIQTRTLADIDANMLPRYFAPDARFAVLRDAMAHVGRPKCVALDELRMPAHEAKYTNELLTGVVSTCYEQFRAILTTAGMPTVPYHESDPTYDTWRAGLETRAEPILGRPDQEGADSHWTVTLTDAERIVMSAKSKLWVDHYGDLPESGSPRRLAREDFWVGDAESSSSLVIVRPVELFFDQYVVPDADGRILRASAVGGVITAVRAFTTGGETILAPLSSWRQLAELAEVPSHHGVFASISAACTTVPDWANYWMKPLEAMTHVVLQGDYPRRVWLENLAAVGTRPVCHLLRLQTPNVAGIVGMFVWLSEKHRPIFFVGSQTSIEALIAGLELISSGHHVVTAEFPEPKDTYVEFIKRVVGEEPWFDAQAISHLQRGLG